jgi:hypothetical protein
MAVRLKGEFDSLLRNAFNNLRQIQSALLRERQQPNTWSKAQVEALMVFFNGIDDLAEAISIMANEARDD